MVSSYITQSIGWSAIALSLSYKMPQIIRIYKRKKGEDISKKSIIMQNLSYVLWLLFGLLIEENLYLISNILSLMLNLIIQYMKHHYHKIAIKPPVKDEIEKTEEISENDQLV